MATVETFNGSSEDGYGTTSSVNTVATTMLIGANSSNEQDVDASEKHVFMFFDTSSLPDNAVVIQVKLSWRVTAFAGNDANIDNKVYIGSNTAGSTLETTDYGLTITNGTLLGTNTTNTAGAKSLTSTADAVCAEVNLTGYTNIEMDAYWNGFISTTAHIITIASQDHGTASYRPQLEITYELPQVISVNMN